MLNFHEKRKWRNIVYSRPVLAVLGFLILLFSFSVFGAYQKERDTNENKEQREEILTDMEERESMLREEIDRLSTEKGIEEEIRSKFEVSRDGEGIIIIVEPRGGEEPVQKIEKKSFWESFFSIF